MLTFSCFDHYNKSGSKWSETLKLCFFEFFMAHYSLNKIDLKFTKAMIEKNKHLAFP